MVDNRACSCPLCGQEFTPKAKMTADETLAQGILVVFKEMQGKEGQGKSTGEPLPCPRCGYIHKDKNGAPSRHADVRICMLCAIEELLMEASGAKPLPLLQWRAVSELLKVFKS